jgi:hypothetical protein
MKTDFPHVWQPVFESRNEAFFCVAYGATRRAEGGESAERGGMPKTSFVRGQRIQSIFQDSFALLPLTYWLPLVKSESPRKYEQVAHLLERLLEPERGRKVDQLTLDTSNNPTQFMR